MGPRLAWPAANEYMQAIQNPQICFADATLRQGKPALDRLGMPVVMSGNFAYVFKLRVGGGARAIKCFRQFLGDRESRYVAVDQHLDAHRIQALAQFEYDADGMSVAGRRYPVVIMEWVEGNTLDVYIDCLMKQQNAKGNLKPLAQQWCELVRKLESGGVAHGDLQHGNVIVMPNGSMKLVDLDGMYVPALNGRRAIELGHMHFQHPRRGQATFDKGLDTFSSLVIYASLLALDDDPALWIDFHDDNLIFTKDDFADPPGSTLFTRMKGRGGEIARVAGVLEDACMAQSPDGVPALSSLVDARASKLPEWMRAPRLVKVQTKTREVPSAPSPGPPRPIPRQTVASSTSGSWTRSTGPVSSPTRSGAATAGRFTTQDWIRKGLDRGFRVARNGVWVGLLASPILVGIAQSIDGAHADSWFLAILLYAAACLGLALMLQRRSSRLKRKTTSAVRAPSMPASTVRTGPTTYRSVTAAAPLASQPIPAAAAAGSEVVGSSIRLIFHRPGCEFAATISTRNRVSFASAQSAVSRGYRSCRVCNP